MGIIMYWISRKKRRTINMISSCLFSSLLPFSSRSRRGGRKVEERGQGMLKWVHTWWSQMTLQRMAKYLGMEKMIHRFACQSRRFNPKVPSSFMMHTLWITLSLSYLFSSPWLRSSFSLLLPSSNPSVSLPMSSKFL